MMLETVLTRLKGVKPTGANQWQALCPAHDDHRPSLCISQTEDGKILLYCQAGCTYEQVCEALGLQNRPSNGRQPKSVCVATFDYKDESGKLLYQVCRFAPKKFRQRRPGLKPGEWVWNLDGVRRVPYRLPELLLASTQDWCFICEGEKDADRLQSLDLIATTNSGGAGKWQADYNQYFKGRLVAIIPDNDVPGRKHAEQVANLLYGIAGEIRIIELPNLSDKEDISDWLDNGGTKNELIRLTNEAKPFMPVAVNFPLTDAGNAERFAAMHRDKLRYCAEHNRWYFWDGCRWNGELGGENAGQLAIVAARAIADDAKDVLDGREREKILLWSISSENAYRLRSMLSLAQNQNPIVCHARDFDKDSYLLNCHNGTLDLHTGTLSEHRAGDMLTKLCPVEYDADAQFDLWDSFLNDVT
jgi:hypothetical protein